VRHNSHGEGAEVSHNRSDSDVEGAELSHNRSDSDGERAAVTILIVRELR
jgi:hypothetical protein